MSEEGAVASDVGRGGRLRSPRGARSPSPEETHPAEGGGQEQPSNLSGSHVWQGGVLRKKLHDQNVTDWSAKYRKNKQSLDGLARDCDLLRSEVAKQQRQFDERAETLRQLEKVDLEVVARFGNAKEAHEAASQQKAQLQVQLAEQRKQKAQLVRVKKFVTADYERKHAELIRMAEARDRLDSQLGQLNQQLGQLSTDRRRMERELELVQHNLRANAELAGEVNTEIEHVFRSVKDSMEMHMVHSSRLEGSYASAQQARDVSPRSTTGASGQR